MTIIKSVPYNVHIGGVNDDKYKHHQFQKNVFGILEQIIKYNEPVNISTKDGNAVIISEEDYNGLMETLYLSSIPAMKEKIKDGISTPLDECLPESEVQW